MSGRVFTEQEKQEQHLRKVRRISSMQFSPVKQLPMTLFMMWMSGNDIHIFSIMILYMALSSPIQALMQTSTVFALFEHDATLRGELTRGKLIYTACCLAAFAVGLLKLHWMGLLPTLAVDWVDHVPPVYRELSSAHMQQQ